MKKLFLIVLLFTVRAHINAQCTNCTPVIPLVDGHFDLWNGGFDATSWICPTTSSVIVTDPNYFSSPYAPNWIRVNGAPKMTYSLQMSTVIDPATGGSSCGTTGSQGVAAYYPFLKNAQYSVKVIIGYYDNNCSMPGNATLEVSATSGLTEPVMPGYYVEAPAVSGTILGTWIPKENSEISSKDIKPITEIFCSDPLDNNYSQLYIKANQQYPETFSAGDPAGMYILVSSVDVSICNTCPTDIYEINSNASTDPVTATPFSTGGLFIDAGIRGGSSYASPTAPIVSVTPNKSTLLMGRWIKLEPNFRADMTEGAFFEAVATSSCESIVDFTGECGPISGNFIPCAGHAFYLTAGAPGGTWTSSNPTVATINPTTGNGYANIVGTTTITYTLGTCTRTQVISVHPSTGCARLVNNETHDSTTSNNVTGSNMKLSIYPNPAQNTVFIAYSCEQACKMHINVKDVDGRNRHSEDVSCKAGVNQQHGLDISSYTPGVYTMEIEIGDEHIVKKVVKL